MILTAEEATEAILLFSSLPKFRSILDVLRAIVHYFTIYAENCTILHKLGVRSLLATVDMKLL